MKVVGIYFLHHMDEQITALIPLMELMLLFVKGFLNIKLYLTYSNVCTV